MLIRLLARFVNNFRMGLATNSSSSHSMVFFRDDRPGHDTVDHASATETEFGWDQFRLTTLGEKLMYALTAQLRSEGYSTWYDSDNGDKIGEAFAKFGPQFPELTLEDFRVASAGYIDHQSAGHSVADLITKARDPKVEFWGGNDNDGDPHEDYTVYDKNWDKNVDPDKAPDGIVDVKYMGGY